jgi:hypothetical protein
VFLTAPDARADDRLLALEWTAPAECPTADAVTQEVHRILKEDDTSSALPVLADATVTQIDARRWRMHLVTTRDGAVGERTLDADSCQSLASAIALILAWTIDPSVVASAPPPTPPPQTPPPLPVENPPPMRPPPPAHRDQLVAVVGATALGDVGSLPSVGLAGEAILGAAFGPVRVEGSVADWATQDATRLSTGVAEGTHIHMIEAALRGCARWALGSSRNLEVGPCVGGGLLFARSQGFGGNPSTFQPYDLAGQWSVLQAALLASWRFVGPLALRASVGLSVPLARPEFVVQTSTGNDTLYQAASIAGRASLGVEAHFQ